MNVEILTEFSTEKEITNFVKGDIVGLAAYPDGLMKKVFVDYHHIPDGINTDVIVEYYLTPAKDVNDYEPVNV